MAESPHLTFAAVGHLAPNDVAMTRALRDVYPTLMREGVEALLVLTMGERGARLVPLGDIASGEELAKAVDGEILRKGEGAPLTLPARTALATCFASSLRLADTRAGSENRTISQIAPLTIVNFKGYDFFLSNRREVDIEEEWPFRKCLDNAPMERPFFVAQRRHPRGTVAGYWVPDQDAGRLGEILRGRHNAFVFSAGGYAPLSDDHAVSQGDFGFTAIQVSSFRGAVPPGGRVTPTIAKRYRCGVITRVYEDHITVSRLALLTGETIGPDWVVPLGEYGALTYARQAKAAARPSWPERAKAKAKLEGEVLTVTFPGAANKGAFEYLVTVKCREGGVEQIVTEKRVFSRAIYGPISSEPKQVACTFARDELFHDIPLKVEVRAMSSFGSASAPISTTVTIASADGQKPHSTRESAPPWA